MPLDPELLAILVCPACKGELEWAEVESKLKCHACRLAYSVVNDIPVMLIDKAEPIAPSSVPAPRE